MTYKKLKKIFIYTISVLINYLSTKTYVISPIWRADLDESDTLDQIREFIKRS